jgi:hypothetical protein
LAAAYWATGWGGLVVLAAACFGATIAILPHILALPLLVIWSGVLTKGRDAGEAPPIWLLPLMALWANLHGSFIFGLALGLFLGGEAVLQPGARLREARRWGVFGVLAVAAALLTPNGLSGFVEPFRLMTMPSLQASFREWLSPDFRTFQPLEICLLGLTALGFTTGARLPLSRMLLLLALCHMALAHVRHAELLGLVGPPAIAASLGPQIAAWIQAAPLSSLSRGITRLAAPAQRPAVVSAFAVAAVMSLVLMMRPIVRTDDSVTPATALDAATRGRLRGPVFNSEGFGGYLIFRGVPTFIDGRVELYGNDFLARYLKAQAGDLDALTALVAQYAITWTLLSPQQGAVRAFDSLPGWHRVYADNLAVIHTRAGPAQ